MYLSILFYVLLIFILLEIKIILLFPSFWFGEFVWGVVEITWLRFVTLLFAG
jgi:hypothetical protein